MKKNTMMRLASVLLVAVLMTTCVISGTFAKYTSTYTATDSARVAKWAFKVDDTDVTSTFDFDLFNTVCDYNETTDDADVKDTGADGAVLIAPGTQGSASVVLTNASEVNAKYAVAFSAIYNTDIPLQWSTNGTGWNNNISDLDIAATTIAMGGTATIAIYWRWAFESGVEGAPTQTDVTDTALGLTGTDTVTFSATVTVTQID